MVDTVVTGNTDLPNPAQAGSQGTPESGSSLPAGFVPYTANPVAPPASDLPPGFVPYTPPAQGHAKTQTPSQGFSDVAPDAGKIDTDDNSNLWKQSAEQIAGVGAGLGKGLLDSMSGAAGVLGQVPLPGAAEAGSALKKRFDEGRAELDKDNAGNPGLNSAGYGLETLSEFMMGDEALKGLDFADRLEAVAKTARILQKSPRLMKALQIGASAGVVQAAQTGIRTDGTMLDRASEAGKAGLVGAGTGAVIGAAGPLVAKAVGKVGKGIVNTADALGTMRATKLTARQAADLANDLMQDTTDAKAKIDSHFEGLNKATTQTERDALQQAQDTRDSETTDAFNNKQDKADDVRSTLEEQKAKIKEQLENRKQTTQAALEKSKQGAQQKLATDLAEKAGTPHDPTELAQIASDTLNTFDNEASEEFEEGMNGDEGVIPRLEGQTEAVVGSPLQDAVNDYLKTPDPDDHELTKKAGEIAGNNLRADIREYLENIQKGSTTAEPDPDAPKPKKGEPKPVPEEIPFEDLTAKDIIAQRQFWRKTMQESFPERGDPNRRAISALLDGYDNTLEKMAGNAEDPAVIDQYQNMRQTYKDKMNLLNSPTAKKLNLKGASPDKALADVNKMLLSGDNVPGKLNTFRRIAGDGTMQAFAKTWVKQVADLATNDPEAAMKMVEGVPENVRNDFLGPQLKGQLDNSVQVYRDSLDHANKLAEAHTTGHIATNASDRAAAEASARYQGIKNTAEHRQAMLDIKNRFNAARQAAWDATEATTTANKSAQKAATEPYTRKLVRDLMTGDVNGNLMNGQVTLNDINAVRDIIGPDKWKDVSREILSNGIAKADGDPGKFMEWIGKIDPSIHNDLFSLNDPLVKAHYDDMLSQLKNAHGYTRAAKVLIGGMAGAGGSVLGAAGLSAFGPIAEAVGAIAGLSAPTAGYKVPLIKALIEKAALNPKLWETASKGAKLVAPVGPGLARGVRSVAKTAALGKGVELAEDARQLFKPPPPQPQGKYIYRGARGLAK